MTLIAVIGPSGCGKSSLVRELDRRGLVRVHPTWTTRPRRGDEHAGSVEHRFVTDEVFDELRAQGFFLAEGALFRLPWRYGLPVIPDTPSSRIDVVMLRAPVVEQVRGLVDISMVLGIDDDPERIARRLHARTSSAEEIAARMADNADEARLGRSIADVTLRNDGSIGELADKAAVAIETQLQVLRSVR